jgi:hypothetical protein
VGRPQRNRVRLAKIFNLAASFASREGKSMTTGILKITSDVHEEELPAFMEHLRAFHQGKTDAQRAAEVRAQDESDGLDSLKRLFDLAHGDSGQCRRVAAFLLGLYNGTRFPFDLTDFRTVDASIFEDMLRVLRLDNRPKVEVHLYFPDGSKRFEALANDWSLHKQEWRPADGGGFSIVLDGYDCVVQPEVHEGRLLWAWRVQAGAGQGWRRPDAEEPVPVAFGRALSPYYAESAIREWFECGGENADA